MAEPTLWFPITVPSKQRSDRCAKVAVSPGVIAGGSARFSDDEANRSSDQGVDYGLSIGEALDGKGPFSNFGGSVSCEDLGQLSASGFVK